MFFLAFILDFIRGFTIILTSNLESFSLFALPCGLTLINLLLKHLLISVHVLFLLLEISELRKPMLLP
jgi:hypothetical protein